MSDGPADAGLLPLHLLVRGRRVVVVGGGPVAARKVAAVLAAGADVLVVAPFACAYATAPSSNAPATPCPRARRPTTKHTIDHTGRSSTGASSLE